MDKVKRQDSLFVESITTALWSLLETKPYNKISVSELVTRAGVGRVTFYRNFSNMEEVLSRSVHQKMMRFVDSQEIDLSNWSDDHLIIALRSFFDFWYEQQDSIRILMTNRLDYLIEDELNHYFQTKLGQMTDNFHIQFIVGGFFRVLKVWITKGCQESPDEIIELLKS